MGITITARDEIADKLGDTVFEPFDTIQKLAAYMGQVASEYGRWTDKTAEAIRNMTHHEIDEYLDYAKGYYVMSFHSAASYLAETLEPFESSDSD